MTWVKLDDKLPEHPKLAGLDVGARWLFIEILCYCNRQLTDGVVTRAELLRLDEGTHPRALDTLSRRNGGAGATHRIDALVQVRLLEREGESYRVHDYAEYQPTRAEVLAQLAAGRVRAKRSRERRANGPSVHPNQGPRSPDPVRSVPNYKDVRASRELPRDPGPRYLTPDELDQRAGIPLHPPDSPPAPTEPPDPPFDAPLW